MDFLPKFFMNFATTPPGASGGGSGDTGGGAGTGGSPAGGGGGSSTPAPSPAGGGAPPAKVDGIEQLRTAYDTVKKEYEPWKSLGHKPDEVKQFATTYQGVVKEVSSVGKQLGYSDEEIIASIHAAGPIATLDFLRNELQEREESGGGGGEEDDQPLTQAQLRQQVQDMVKQGLQPIHAAENVRRTDKANDLFEHTTRSLAAAHFKGLGVDIATLPQDALQFIMDATSEIFKYDTPGLTELKMQGKTTGVQRAFNDAMDRLDRYYVARRGWENKGQPMPGGKGQPGAGGGTKKPTLDDMIENPELVNAKYKA